MARKLPAIRAQAVSALADDARIQALIQGRDLDAARQAIESRLTADPHDAEAWFYRAACAMVERHFNLAQADFQQAAIHAPNVARYVSAQAAACLAGQKAEEALLLSRRALDIDANDLASRITLLQSLIRLSRFEEALPHAEALAKSHLDVPEARQLMGEVLRGLYRYSAALSWFEAAMELQPEDVRPQIDIAVCVSHMGNVRSGQKIVQNVLEMLPEDDPEVFSRLGIRAQEAGSPQLALLFFKQGFTLFPQDMTLCMNLGITVQGLGNPGEALFYFQRALVLDEAAAQAWFYAANSYQALRNPDEAKRSLEKCIEYAPGHAQALAHLASLRKEAGQLDEAKKLLRQAIDADPQWLQPYLNLHGFLKDADDLEAADAVLKEAQAVDPDSEAVQQAVASLLLKRGDITAANVMFRKMLQAQPSNPDAMSGLLFCSNYDPELTPQQIADAYMSWNDRFVQWRAPAPDFKYANKPTQRRRIKVGYVSGDFRGHSVAFFFEPLLAHHDHDAFEIYCYSNFKGGDATTQRMMGMTDHWRWVHDLSDEALVEMIRLDGIDILIDLSNHTGYHRLYMFGRRPAPIQMTTIGMPTTTGLRAIDWRITDAWMDPPGMTESLHSEKLLRIVSGWCYRPSDEGRVLPVTELPALRNGHLTLASFNAFGKINPQVFTLWGRLLQAVPNAVLYVATGGKADDEVLNAQVRQTCGDCGVPLDRLRLLPRMPLKAYFEFHQQVDIVLDAFPYTGATVTAHALWMGVPVITLAGPSPIHRSATSMMHSVGLSGFVAQTKDGYIAIARHWADRIEALAQIRRTLRENMQKSPLMDGTVVTKDLEVQLRKVWIDWCKSQKTRRHKEKTE